RATVILQSAAQQSAWTSGSTAQTIKRTRVHLMKRLPVLLFAAAARALAADAPPDFAEVYRLMDERCIECHTADDPEGNLVLETYEGLLKGGETGKAIEPGKSAESLLMK